MSLLLLFTTKIQENIYYETITDNISISDTITNNMIFDSMVEDILSGSDANPNNLSFGNTLADSVLASDLLSTILAYSNILTDNVLAMDSVSHIYNTDVALADMAKLFDVNDGIKVTITADHTKIQEDVTDYPCLLLITDELERLFDVIGNDYKKIRITDSKGNNCYIEVVSWDAGTRFAELYFKADLSSTSDTVFILRASPTFNDNSFIGEYGTDAAKEVWS